MERPIPSALAWSKFIGNAANQSTPTSARRMGEILDTLVVASGKPPAWLLEEVRASTFDPQSR